MVQHPNNETQNIHVRTEPARETRSGYGSSFILVAVALVVAVFVGAYVLSDNDATVGTAPTSQSTIEVMPSAPATETPAPQSDAAPAAPAPTNDAAPATDAAPAGTDNQ